MIVQLPNIAELVVLYFAAARSGLILSPVPMQYGAHELEHVHSTIEARAYVSLDAFKGTPFGQPMAECLPSSVATLLFGEAAGEPEARLDLDRVSEDDAAIYSAHASSIEIDADDIITICWTSGTTGQPKGVPRSHNHWLATTIGSEDAAELSDGAVLLNPFPFVNMASIGGFLYLWLRLRGALVLHHPFDPGIFLGQLQDERVEYTVAPPALLSRLLQQPQLLERFDLSRLRRIGSGSAPVAPAIVREFRSQLGIEILNLFGSNEGICLVSAPNDIPEPEDRAAYFPRFGGIGLSWKNRAGRFFETRLVDLDTREDIHEPGRPGELLISGPTVFDGYFVGAGQADETRAEVFDTRGFFRTGDVFEIADGPADGCYLRFVGRSKDIIVRGGMKISPSELDTLLEGFPGLVEAAVYGVPDPEMEQRVGVVVVPAEGAVPPTLEAITRWLEDKGVARFKWPESVAVTSALPRNPLNKVLRQELAGLFAAHTERDEIGTGGSA